MSFGVDTSEITPHELCARRSLASAVAWTLSAELARRYGATYTFQPIEMHPCSGMYDLFSLFSVRDATASAYDRGSLHVADFNLYSGTLRRVGDPDDLRFPWLKRWVGSADPKEVVDELSAFLLLPPIKLLPPTDRRIFGFRLVAGLLRRHAMERRALDANMAFWDTSGYGGGVDQGLRVFSAAWDAGASTQPHRWWLLRRGPSRKIVGVVDLNGRLSGAAAPGALHDLFPLFLAKRSVEPVLRLADDVLDG